jgi:LPXTG-site transpeptidase (sortase) family protein
MLSLLAQVLGRTPLSRAGGVLMVLGLGLLSYSALAYAGLAPGGYGSVPEPVALSTSGERSVRLVSPAMQPTPSLAADEPVAPTEPVPALTQPLPAVAEPPATAPSAAAARLLPAADQDDRKSAALAPRPGVPVRLQLPSIKVDTEVKPGGLIAGADGEPEWETLPFVATTYPMLGLVGAPGNPVVSGHVVTLREGNVFRDLYQVELGEPIEVYTETSRFSYTISEIKLVSPSAVDVLAPSDDARITVITCGGSFDPRTRTFSDRLIVVGQLVGGERLERSD